MAKFASLSWLTGRARLQNRPQTLRSRRRQALLEALENRALMAAPAIGSLSVSPIPVTQPANLTMTANNVTDADGDNTVTKVEFWLDANLNGALDQGSDLKLGEDTDGSDGWSLTVASSTPPLASKAALNLMARASDASTFSTAVSTQADVQRSGAPIVRSWTNYIGSTSTDVGWDVVVDDDGFVYVVGTTTANGDTDSDAFVSKFNSDGTQIWRQLLGGGDNESGLEIAVDSSGSLYVIGETASTGWISGGFDTTFNGGITDAFAAKLDSETGSVTWSTYIGGTQADDAHGVAYDSDGNLYVVGRTLSAGWITGGLDTTLDGDEDAYLVKISSDGSQVLLQTYIGSDGLENGSRVAVDSQGKIYVVGQTNSNGWISGGFDTTLGTDGTTFDGFVVILNANGSTAESTYVGGAGTDSIDNIVIDANDNIYIVGSTSVGGWISGGFDTTFGGQQDAFIIKATLDGPVWGSFIGGTQDENAWGLTVDQFGSVYVAVDSQSTSQAVNGLYASGGRIQNIAPDSQSDLTDALLLKINPSGSGTVSWASYFGGTRYDVATAVAVDSAGRVYATGLTASPGLTKGTGTEPLIGNNDAFLAKFGYPLTATSLTAAAASYYRNESFTVTANGIAASTAPTSIITGVEFYLDVNDDGTIDGGDTLLGTDTNSAGGYTLSTSFNPAGLTTILARATDGDVYSNTVSLSVNIIDYVPNIASVAASPNPAYRNQSVTLTASGISLTGAPGGTLPTVEFYRDVNSNGLIDVGTDTLLGSDNNATGGYTLSTSFADAGTVTILARTLDDVGTASAAVSTSLTVQNYQPQLTSIAASPNPAYRNQTATITATGASLTGAPGGTKPSVEFYRDVNSNGIIDVGTDTLLGTDDGADNSWTATASFPNTGTITILARSKDDTTVYSSTVSTTLTIRAYQPQLTSIAAAPSPVIRNQNFTITASGVSITGAPVEVTPSVEFYLDVNGNGIINVGTDTLLGSDSNATGGYTLTTSLPTAGTYTLLARSKDDTSNYSSTVSTTITINPYTPVISSVGVAPNPAYRNQSVTLTASGVSLTGAPIDVIPSVEFYRDINGNNAVDVGLDTLLGTDDGADSSWTLSTSFPTAGTVTILARTKNDTNNYSAAVATTLTVQNYQPQISSIAAAPNPAYRNQTTTITATGVSLTGAPGDVSASVEFYRDVNSNNTIDGADILLGTDTSSVGGFTLATSFADAGTVKILARSKDDSSNYSSTVSTTLTVSPYEPQLTSIAASPNPAYRNQSVTVTASGVSLTGAPGGVIPSVEFYLDLNSNNTIDVGTDTLLGSDDGADGFWTLTTSFASTGSYKILARSKDDTSNYSATASTTLTVQNYAPQITSVAASPNPAYRNQSVTLTASGVSLTGAPGSVNPSVEFYRDVNSNNLIDIGTDVLLGSDSNSAGGYTFSTSFPDVGSVTILARTLDDVGTSSAAVATTLTVQNYVPQLTSISALPNPALRYQSITITANGASLTGAPVNVKPSVEFYRDLNSNNIIDDADTLLGTDDGADGSWTVSPSFANAGSVTILARSKDDSNNSSATVSTTLTINAFTPVITSIAVVPNPVYRNQNFTITASGVSITGAPVDLAPSVEFYRDVNSNNIIDGGDTLLGTDANATGGYTLTTSFASAGSVTILARTKDDTSNYSSTVTTSLTVQNYQPQITAVTGTPNPAFVNESVTLSATGVSITGAPENVTASVQFWLDGNSNNTIDGGDTLLGTDSNSAGGYTLAVSFDTAGTKTILARSTDGDVFSSTVTMSLGITDYLPIIGSVSASPSPAYRNQTVTLTATGVGIDGQQVDVTPSVEFYLDVNSNNTIDVGTDTLLGTDDGAGGEWTLDTSFGTAGTVTILARSVDDKSDHSGTVSTTLTVQSYSPQITSVSTITPIRPVKNDTITLVANGVSVTGAPGDFSPTVEFYRDVNSNGIIDVGTDTLLGSDNNATGGYTLSLTTLPTATSTIMARVVDDASIASSTVTTTVRVQESVTFSKTSPLTFTDANGDKVTLTLKGLGTGKAYFNNPITANAPLTFNQDAQAIVLQSTDIKTTLGIAVAKKGRTTIQDIETNGSLSAISAAAVDGVAGGVISIAQLLKTLTIGNMSGLIELNGSSDTVKLNVKGNSFNNSVIDAPSVALGKINVLQWSSVTDGAAITARSMDSFATRAGNASLDLTLTNAAAKKTLGTVTIKGDLKSSTWNIAGITGAVTVNRVEDSDLNFANLTGFTVKGVTGSPASTAFSSTNLIATGTIKSAKLGRVNPDNDGTEFTVQANQIDTITFTTAALNSGKTITLSKLKVPSDLTSPASNKLGITFPVQDFRLVVV